MRGLSGFPPPPSGTWPPASPPIRPWKPASRSISCMGSPTCPAPPSAASSAGPPRATSRRSSEPWTARLAAGDLPSDAEIASFLDRAETVRTLFGSLVVERPDNGEDPGWLLPLELLRDLRQALRTRPDADPLLQRLDRLLGGFTRGLLTFYDAVPKPGQKDLLALDVLNPHYPDFYRAKNRKVPSDDQDPIPVSFLTVRAEAAFVFPFRLHRLPEGELPQSSEELTRKVAGWLETALKTLGAGAKTASGYGYFQNVEPARLQEGVQSTPLAPK